jgi:hypothetical protein
MSAQQVSTTLAGNLQNAPAAVRATAQGPGSTNLAQEYRSIPYAIIIIIVGIVQKFPQRPCEPTIFRLLVGYFCCFCWILGERIGGK